MRASHQAIAASLLALLIPTGLAQASDEFSERAAEANARKSAIEAIRNDYGSLIAATASHYHLLVTAGLMNAQPAKETTPGIGWQAGVGVGWLIPLGSATLDLRLVGAYGALPRDTCQYYYNCSHVGGEIQAFSLYVDAPFRLRPSSDSRFFFGVGPRVGVGLFFGEQYLTYSKAELGPTNETATVSPTSPGYYLHGLGEIGIQLLESRKLELMVGGAGGINVSRFGPSWSVHVTPSWVF